MKLTTWTQLAIASSIIFFFAMLGISMLQQPTEQTVINSGDAEAAAIRAARKIMGDRWDDAEYAIKKTYATELGKVASRTLARNRPNQQPHPKAIATALEVATELSLASWKNILGDLPGESLNDGAPRDAQSNAAMVHELAGLVLQQLYQLDGRGF